MPLCQVLTLYLSGLRDVVLVPYWVLAVFEGQVSTVATLVCWMSAHKVIGRQHLFEVSLK